MKTEHQDGDTEADILQIEEVRQYLERVRLEHEKRMGAPPPPLRTRGKQHRINKVTTTIRLSQEVLVAFKSTGKGWQTRINAALQRLVAEGKV